MPYWRLFYHLVWATRDRSPLIRPEIEAVVHRELRAAARHHRMLIHAVGGTIDHVHVVASIPPSIAVASAVKQIKGASARAIRAEIGDFGWQAEYGAITFAERHLASVAAYVNDQPRHHADRKLWPLLEQIGDPAPWRRSADAHQHAR